MDIFSIQVLSKVVERLHTPPSFLLDTFFPNVQTSDKEEILFDVTDSKPRISPFVSPLLPGKVVDSGGYRTKSFKPAYVKDKRCFDANIPYKRIAGETIGGSLSPSQRYERALATTLTDQLDNLTRREEVMAAEILRTGKVIVSGCRNCWKRKKTPPRPSQMALRRRAKLLRRMLRVKSALSVPQVPIYRNNLKNRCRLSGLGDFAQTFRT